jgi:hypothetical protein
MATNPSVSDLEVVRIMLPKNVATSWILIILMGMSGLSPAATTGTSDATEQSAAAGKWIFSATANCRCEDNSCKVISCSGESGVSYEDAKFKAQLSLASQARLENGKIDGAPSITIRFESKITESVNAEQSQLTVFTYQIRYFVRGAVVHEETWETVAQNPTLAAAYAGNHSMAVSQRLRERRLDIDRTSAVVTGKRPL